MVSPVFSPDCTNRLFLEIKYFSIICLGKFFHLRKLVVQNLYGFVWTIKICFAKKSCLYSLGKTQGRPLWCTLYLWGFIIYFANTCLAECTQMFACFSTVWTNLQRRPAIQITSYIFNHMIKYTYFASSLKSTVLYFGFARFTAVSLLKTTKNTENRKDICTVYNIVCTFHILLPPSR